MLSSLVKQHQARQQARKDRQERRKREAIVAATALTHALVDHLNGGYAGQYFVLQDQKIGRDLHSMTMRHEALILGMCNPSGMTFPLETKLLTRVAQAYVNQKKLDTETKILQANASQFSKQTMQWLKLVEDFNTALKELGDVENWARSIETDMRTISSALEYAYRKSE